MSISKQITAYLLLLSGISLPQNSLDYYLNQGINNAPTLSEYQNLKDINTIQSELNSAENSGLNVFLSADYLFAPYFNNNGKLISANPDPKAIGYDVGISNGGLYLAQLNVGKNILNGGLIDALQNQNNIQSEQYSYNYALGKHNLEKQITDQYIEAYKSLQLFYLSKESVSNLNEQLNIAADLIGQGFLTARDYLLMKIELENEEINKSESFQNYKNDLVHLNTLCGIKDTNTVYLDSLELQRSLTINNSGFFRKYELDSLSLITQQSVFETKYLPQLKLFFNTGLNAVELKGIERKFGLSAGLSFSLPIFDGGQKSLTRQQNLIYQKTIGDYSRYFSSNLELIIINTAAKLKTIKKNIEELDNQISEYKKVMTISTNDLNKGDISTIEFLTILKNFIDLKKSKIEKENEYQMEINNFNYWNWQYE